LAWAVVIAGTLLSVASGAAGAAADSGSATPAAGQMSPSYDPGADKQDLVKEISAAFCAQDPDGELHTTEWLAAVDSWQAVTPYHLNKPESPSALARDRLFGEPRLTEDTRRQTCDSMTSFAKALKDVTLDIKGPLWDGCATEKGLSAFYDYKLQAIRAINDHNWPKVTALMPGWRDPAKFLDHTTVNCSHLPDVTDPTP
jgi:hypothetical protein